MSSGLKTHQLLGHIETGVQWFKVSSKKARCHGGMDLASLD